MMAMCRTGNWLFLLRGVVDQTMSREAAASILAWGANPGRNSYCGPSCVAATLVEDILKIVLYASAIQNREILIFK